MPDTSDTNIESTLRHIVSTLFASQDFDSLTLKRVRADASKRLKFPEEFFKTDIRWKERSKEVVNDEVEKQEAKRAAGGNGQSEAVDSSPVVRNGRNVIEKKEEASPAKRKRGEHTGRAKAGAKRKSAEAKKPAPRKRRKALSEDDESEVELTSAEDTSASSDAPSEEDEASESASDSGSSAFSDHAPKKQRKPGLKAAPPRVAAKSKPKNSAKAGGKNLAPARAKRKTVVSSDEENEARSDQDSTPDVDKELSDSALTELSDSPPVKQRSRKQPAKRPAKPTAKQTKSAETVQDDSGSEADPKEQITPVNNDAENGSGSETSVVYDEPPTKKSKKAQSTTKPKPTTSSKPTTSPADEEIKKLQGWLVKCGIRKLWGKELAPFSTSAAKISHLKGMLKDAGMTGRYSEQRAREIRDQRELRADLEDIVEREKVWGEDDEDGEDGEKAGRPKRRLAKGLRELAELSDVESDE